MQRHASGHLAPACPDRRLHLSHGDQSLYQRKNDEEEETNAIGTEARRADLLLAVNLSGP